MASTPVQSELQFQVYRAAFECLSTVDLILQLYAIFLMLRVTPNSLKEYRNFMLMCAIFDLLFVVSVGFVLNPNVLLPFPCASVRGLGRFLGRKYAGFSLLLPFYFGTMTLLSQLHSLVYRTLLIYSLKREQKRLARPINLLVATAVYSSLAVIICVSVGRTFQVEEELPKPDWPFISPSTGVFFRDLLHSGDDVFFCITVFAKQMPAAIVVAVISAVGLTFALILVALILRKMAPKQSAFTAKTRSMQNQLTILLFAQVLSPVVCIFVPILGWIFTVTVKNGYVTPQPVEFGITFFTSFPLFNSFLTITFVGPYRTFTRNWISAIFSCKRNTSNRVSYAVNTSAARRSFSESRF